MACDTPYSVKNPRFKMTGKDLFIPVPCGKCPACKARRASGWSYRLMQQAKVAETSHFITFTYANPPKSPNGFSTLYPPDWQLFVKHYRNHFRYRAVNPATGKRKWYYDKVPKISYYLAGEYGEHYGRPHYHAIMFNVDPALADTIWRQMSPNNGHTFTGDLTYASAAYTAKYINKGGYTKKHARDDRHPEFSLMSKGLGKNYLSDEMLTYHRNDISRSYITLDGGQKVSLPRYYKNKIYNEEQRTRQSEIIIRLNADREIRDRLAHRSLYGNEQNFERNRHENVKARLANFDKQPKRKEQ